MKEKMKLVVECLRLELEVKKLKAKTKILEVERDEYRKNNEYLENEVAILKQINRKRYVQQEDKMHYLKKRNDKLQSIEDMVNKGEHWKTIKTKIMEAVR